MKKTIWKYTCVLRSVFVIFDVRIYVGKFFWPTILEIF
jgi:hypothetical protein